MGLEDIRFEIFDNLDEIEKNAEFVEYDRLTDQKIELADVNFNEACIKTERIVTDTKEFNRVYCTDTIIDYDDNNQLLRCENIHNKRWYSYAYDKHGNIIRSANSDGNILHIIRDPNGAVINIYSNNPILETEKLQANDAFPLPTTASFISILLNKDPLKKRG